MHGAHRARRIGSAGASAGTHEHDQRGDWGAGTLRASATPIPPFGLTQTTWSPTLTGSRCVTPLVILISAAESTRGGGGSEKYAHSLVSSGPFTLIREMPSS